MTWEAATNQIADNTAKIVAQTALGFNAEISSSRVWPTDTGFSRRAWIIGQESEYSWIVRNGAKYAGILWVGRRPDASGVMRGSLQMPLGGQPIFDKWQRKLEDKLRKVTQ